MMTATEIRKAIVDTYDDAKNFLDMHSKDGVMSEENSKIYEETFENKINAYQKQLSRIEKLGEFDNAIKAPTSRPILSTPSTGAIDNEFVKSLKIKNYNGVGTDTDGGYLVPDEFDKTLVNKLSEENVMRSLATVIKTNSGDHQIPVVSSQGVAYLAAEGGKYTESDPTFTQKSLGAYKFICRSVVSEELLNDSAFDLESFLANEFARRIGALEEEYFCTGTGTNQPKGVFTAASAAHTIKTTTITFDDIMEVFYSVKTPYRKKGTWLLNDTTVKALRKLKDSTGNYIWQPSISSNMPDMILGRPYVTSAFAPVLADKKAPIAFGDFSYYWIADRQKRTFKRLGELYAENGLVGFIGSERVDGDLILDEAIKTLKIDSEA